jgi:hypothetical protein
MAAFDAFIPDELTNRLRMKQKATRRADVDAACGRRTPGQIDEAAHSFICPNP